MNDELRPEEIQRLRSAAEQSWGDDTRHQKFQSDPLLAAGQCYVTSAWLKQRMGGHVGVKNGHYFWLSPDKQHALDLVNDRFAFPPGNPDYEGLRADADDPVGYQLPKFRREWQAAPPIYKRSSHHLFDGARVINRPPNERANLFIQRANEAYDQA
jgi:hypothetical protein